MKKCKNCGAIQNDTHMLCIDCGERLGEPLSKQEEQEVEKEVAKKLKKLSDKKDYFYVSRLDKIVALLLIIGLVISFVIRIFGRDGLEEMDLALLILAIILMTITAIDLSFPYISWELYKLKFIFALSNFDDLQPSEIALYLRRFCAYAVCIVGYIYLISVFIRYLIL